MGNARFCFQMTEDYGRGGGKLYHAEALPVSMYGLSDYSDLLAEAKYTTRGVGVNTAYATFRVKVCWACNQSWGLCVTKHFRGRSAWLKARGWLNMMLNNMPSSWSTFSEESDSRGRAALKVQLPG